jgi:hypothetical protein
MQFSFRRTCATRPVKNYQFVCGNKVGSLRFGGVSGPPGATPAPSAPRPTSSHRMGQSRRSLRTRLARPGFFVGFLVLDGGRLLLVVGFFLDRVRGRTRRQTRAERTERRILSKKNWYRYTTACYFFSPAFGQRKNVKSIREHNFRKAFSVDVEKSSIWLSRFPALDSIYFHL